MSIKNVLIVGGGFGGLHVAKGLGNQTGLHIQLIDRRNYHLFQPLLYQIAMAGLSPADIAAPLRSILSPFKNAEVFLGNVEHVDLKLRKVRTSFASLSYDYLVLACGAKHSYFGRNEWEEFAPGLKTLEQATEIRRRVFLAYEKAERETNSDKQKESLTFIIVGGGPTGVELAGALGEISRFTLNQDFRHIDPKRTKIILIEAGSRILPSFSEKLSSQATRDLEALGVTVWTSSKVTEISSNGVQVGAEFIRAGTVLWAAGVQPSSLGKDLGVSLDAVGRVVVQKDLSVLNYSQVFVIGDQAACLDESGRSLPGLAPVAIQQGNFVARSILRDLKGKPREVFRYRDKGQMATIGRRKAIAQTAGLQFSGFLAWMAWLLIHIYYLIGFKNRLFVLMQWTWSYFTFKRGARLIVNKEWRSNQISHKPNHDQNVSAEREKP